MDKILLIVNEQSICNALTNVLNTNGYGIVITKDGMEGYYKAATSDFDLILLDDDLPETDGLELCKQLRNAQVNSFILLLSSKKQGVNKVVSLENGADDFMVKPFSSRELNARVNSLLWRKRNTRENIEVYSFKNVTVDFLKYEVKKNGQPVHLTPLEFAVLRCLINNAGNVICRDNILDTVWKDENHLYHSTINTHIYRLRSKLEDEPTNPSHIISVRGVGYKFVD